MFMGNAGWYAKYVQEKGLLMLADAQPSRRVGDVGVWVGV
jgi:hypothetical protein